VNRPDWYRVAVVVMLTVAGFGAAWLTARAVVVLLAPSVR
jgi:hypothetical protein